MVNFDLSRLGDDRFEHLTQSLALAALGPGVEVFGDGPDGGREATLDGTFDIPYCGTDDHTERWSGYGVLQAKYKAQLHGTSSDQIWFLARVREEMGRWNEFGSRRGRYPEFVLFATNVTLSPATGGGIDQFNDLMLGYQREDGRLRGWQVWHADKFDRLLETQTGVRIGYADLVLPGDVIARLYAQLEEDDARVARAWVGHAGRAIRAGRNVSLVDSGDKTASPLLLDQVAVDLPAAWAGAESTPAALAAVVARADAVMQPSLRPDRRERVVIIGGPGQGKSTLAQLLCQIYRAAMLDNGNVAVAAETRVAARSSNRSFAGGGLPAPSLHRAPVLVSLPVYADLIGGGSDLSLLRHIGKIVNHGATDAIADSDLRRLFRRWPSIVVLDGLDEVPSGTLRETVASRITDFMDDMTSADADVFVVATTRPQGFGDALSREFYDHLHLEPLDRPQALTYAGRLLLARHPDDPDRRDIVIGRLDEAADSAVTAGLMTSPLQMTIMTLLLEQRVRAPRSRYRLFSAYYDIVYQREANKSAWMGELLERHRAQIDALHQYAALTIHRAADLGDAEAVITEGGLEKIAADLLAQEEWPATDRDKLLADLMLAARERLVLLVPRYDGLGFEIRSLQEFMAARALTTGSDTAIPTQLHAIAASAHWRNTWLLAAGRVFADRTALRAEITSIVNDIDTDSYAAMVAAPGAALALDVLDDGLAAEAPIYEHRLLVSTLRLLDGPVPFEPSIRRIASTVRHLAERGPDTRARVEQQLQQRLASSDPSLPTVALLAELQAPGAGGLAEWARIQLDTAEQLFTAGDLVVFRGMRAAAGHSGAESPVGMYPPVDTDFSDDVVTVVNRDGTDGIGSKLPNLPVTKGHLYDWVTAAIRPDITMRADTIAEVRDLIALAVASAPPPAWQSRSSWALGLTIGIASDSAEDALGRALEAALR